MNRLYGTRNPDLIIHPPTTAKASLAFHCPLLLTLVRKMRVVIRSILLPLFATRTLLVLILTKFMT